MGGQTVVIVPATVPSAVVQRIARAAPEQPVLVSAQPAVVAAAHAVPVIPQQLTAEQVELLQAENEMLREELSRVRAD